LYDAKYLLHREACIYVKNHHLTGATVNKYSPYILFGKFDFQLRMKQPPKKWQWYISVVGFNERSSKHDPMRENLVEVLGDEDYY